MAATFDLNDDTVVVVIGSGAGGGTLGTELALKGIRTIVLEAGPRVEKEEFENDEWANFVKISWLDKRIATGCSCSIASKTASTISTDTGTATATRCSTSSTSSTGSTTGISACRSCGIGNRGIG